MAEEIPEEVPIDPEFEGRKPFAFKKRAPKRRLLPSILTIFLSAIATVSVLLLFIVLDFTGILEVHSFLPEQIKKTSYFNDYFVRLQTWRLPEQERIERMKKLHAEKINQVMTQFRQAEAKNNFWQVKLNDERKKLADERKKFEKDKNDFDARVKFENERLAKLNKDFDKKVKEFNEKALSKKLATMLQNMNAVQMAETFNEISDDLLLVKYLSQLKPAKSAEILNNMDT
ncbi:hypothetical protein ACFL35_16090, partial [Candidatus Riflebacteria bacterium]